MKITPENIERLQQAMRVLYDEQSDLARYRAKRVPDFRDHGAGCELSTFKRLVGVHRRQVGTLADELAAAFVGFEDEQIAKLNGVRHRAVLLRGHEYPVIFPVVPWHLREHTADLSELNTVKLRYILGVAPG